MTDQTETLTAEEIERIQAWARGDDAVSLASLLDDSAAFPDVSRAVREALREALATPPAAGLDVDAVFVCPDCVGKHPDYTR